MATDRSDAAISPEHEYVCPTCERPVSEVVIRITGVCPTHGVTPIVCGNPGCWCVETLSQRKLITLKADAQPCENPETGRA